MYVGVLEAPNPSKIEPYDTQGGPETNLMSPKGPQKSALVNQGVPQSIRMAIGTPLDHRARPRRKRDLERNSKDQPFWLPLAAPGRSKAPFWIPGGFQNDTQIDMGRQGRHLLGPRWAKRLFQRGSQNGIEKVIEKGFQNESFWDA